MAHHNNPAVIRQGSTISPSLVLAGSLLTASLLPGAPAWGQCAANELAKLTASDAALEDRFGHSVSISGGAVVIGAYLDDDAGIRSGSAYVFEKPRDGWVDMTETAKLTASDAAEFQWFGRSVSISGDFVVVSGAGSVYVFEKPSGGWVNMTETAKLTASDGVSFFSRFGEYVSISGDVVLIGARSDDHAGWNSGSAYVFKKPKGGWVDMTETAKLTASDAAAGDQFGASVSLSGDVALIGAFHQQTGKSDHDAGWVYVFRFDGTNWVEEGKLTPSDPAANNQFGNSVAISGDVALIGDWRDDDGCPANTDCFSGSAYVYRFNGTSWIEEAKLTASDATSGDAFGESVSVSGDMALIGAVWDDEGLYDTGSAYLFRFDGTNWIEEAKLTASDPAWADRFGKSVSTSGDVAVIGAFQPFPPPYPHGPGKAYVFGGLADCNDNGELDLCDITDGTSQDADANGIPDECECPWDLDGNSTVGILDLLALLAAWGTNPGGPPDFDGDGTVGILDLLILLTNWGPCP
ncbi:MAG: FG-GAP repeat protein [Planctomycetes bacterium]|nr:FG-GAP repeat protein [Planctomycetota bacterium]